MKKQTIPLWLGLLLLLALAGGAVGISVAPPAWQAWSMPVLMLLAVLGYDAMAWITKGREGFWRGVFILLPFLAGGGVGLLLLLLPEPPAPSAAVTLGSGVALLAAGGTGLPGRLARRVCGTDAAETATAETQEEGADAAPLSETARQDDLQETALPSGQGETPPCDCNAGAKEENMFESADRTGESGIPEDGDDRWSEADSFVAMRQAAAWRTEARRRVDTGLFHPMTQRYAQLANMALAPPGTFERCLPGQKLRRVVLMLLCMFLPAAVLPLKAAMTGTQVGTAAFLALLLLPVLAAVLCTLYGLWRGLLYAVVTAAGVFAAAYGGQLFGAAAAVSPLCVVLLALLLAALLAVGLFYGLRFLFRRYGTPVTVFERGPMLHGVLYRQALEPFTIPRLRKGVLFRAVLDFEPFGNCEQYYFYDKCTDLNTFCRLHRYRLCGFAADNRQPRITYYLYAEQRVARHAEEVLRRYFRTFHHKALTVEGRPDPTYEGYVRLLPTVAELFASYHRMLFSCLNPEAQQMMELVYTCAFPQERQAMDFVRYLEKAGTFRQVRVYGSAGDPGGVAVRFTERMYLSENPVNGRVQQLLAEAQARQGTLEDWDIAGESPEKEGKNNG